MDKVTIFDGFRVVELTTNVRGQYKVYNGKTKQYELWGFVTFEGNTQAVWNRQGKYWWGRTT